MHQRISDEKRTHFQLLRAAMKLRYAKRNPKSRKMISHSGKQQLAVGSVSRLSEIILLFFALFAQAGRKLIVQQRQFFPLFWLFAFRNFSRFLRFSSLFRSFHCRRKNFLGQLNEYRNDNNSTAKSKRKIALKQQQIFSLLHCLGMEIIRCSTSSCCRRRENIFSKLLRTKIPR